MKTRWFKEILYVFCLIFLWPTLSLADPWNWKNPGEIIKDPMIVRLQQGRKELTPQEREEIQKFGYTGLELMTYVDFRDIPNPGFDNRFYWRFTKVDKHGIRRRETWMRSKLKYKSLLDLASPNSRYHPGDWESSYRATVVFPPAKEKLKTIVTNYFKSKENYKDEDLWIWLPDLRKTRRTVLSGSDKFLLSEITWDDRIFRKPWEEEHRILGEDTIRGLECFVVESRNWFKPNYYLSKRVTWVERDNFLDIHEEQFDQEGKLYKIFDKKWVKIKPWDYWFMKELNGLDLKEDSRCLEETFDHAFNLGFEDSIFSLEHLGTELEVKIPSDLSPPINDLSQFPPKPKVREEFWSKIGVKP